MKTFIPKYNRVKQEIKPYIKYEPYNVYLESDHWRQTKQKSSVIYGHKCVVCDSPNNIESHHLFYPKNRCDILAHQVIPLCDLCHSSYHTKAPNKGINLDIKSPSQINKLIKEVFKYVKIERRLDKADPKWLNAVSQRENKTTKLFRQYESSRHKRS